MDTFIEDSGPKLQSECGFLPRGSNVVPFWIDLFWLRDSNILPKKELHSSLWVETGIYEGCFWESAAWACVGVFADTLRPGLPSPLLHEARSNQPAKDMEPWQPPRLDPQSV